VFHSALVGCSDPLCGLRPELPPRPSGDALANRAFRVRRPTERRCERWRPALVRRPPAGRTSDVLPSSVIDQGDQAFERHLHMILEPDVIGDTTEGQVEDHARRDDRIGSYTVALEELREPRDIGRHALADGRSQEGLRRRLTRCEIDPELSLAGGKCRPDEVAHDVVVGPIVHQADERVTKVVGDALDYLVFHRRM